MTFKGTCCLSVSSLQTFTPSTVPTFFPKEVSSCSPQVSWFGVRLQHRSAVSVALTPTRNAVCITLATRGFTSALQLDSNVGHQLHTRPRSHVATGTAPAPPAPSGSVCLFPAWVICDPSHLGVWSM